MYNPWQVQAKKQGNWRDIDTQPLESIDLCQGLVEAYTEDCCEWRECDFRAFNEDTAEIVDLSNPFDISHGWC